RKACRAATARPRAMPFLHTVARARIAPARAASGVGGASLDGSPLPRGPGFEQPARVGRFQGFYRGVLADSRSEIPNPRIARRETQSPLDSGIRLAGARRHGAQYAVRKLSQRFGT